MKTRVLRGSKQEIAADLVRINGEVREAIVFVEDTASTNVAGSPDAEDIFVEMRPFMVDAPDLDDSRAAIYTRLASE